MATSTNVYRAIIRGLASGQEFINHLDYVASGSGVAPHPTQAAMEDLADYLNTFWEDEICDHLSDAYVLNNVWIDEIIGYTVLDTIPFKYSINYSRRAYTTIPVVGVGQIGGEYLPLTNSISVRKITSSRLRPFRGSMRLGPVAEVSQTNGTVDPTLRGALLTDLNILFDGFHPGGGAVNSWDPVVFGPSDNTSRTLGFKALPQTFTLSILNGLVHPSLGTQNSRKPRLSP